MYLQKVLSGKKAKHESLNLNFAEEYHNGEND